MKFILKYPNLYYYKLIFLDEHNEFFVELKELVEKVYKINGGVPVTLVGHSMGGRMVFVFLQMQTQDWKDKHIKSFVSLATPWGGSFKALKMLVYGDNFDIGATISTT